MPRRSLAQRLALWGVDRPPAEPAMLLDFIDQLAQGQPLPPLPETRQELQDRREPLQRRLRASLGLDPWPERTPFAARVVGALERGAYRIEKHVYEAWPGLPVTAHLYVPAAVGGRAPGLVYTCGHWMENGKLTEHIQRFCAAMATLGIVTLVYDPIGQGERLGSWRDHGHLNALLVGGCQLGLMVWETIRALDYLASRPDVESTRIGITGASGGGLNTLYAAAIDERFYCAIPAAYPCTFLSAMQAERDLNWEDGADVCNQVPQVMSYAEMSDIASLFIPRPAMVLACRRDVIFPIAGTRQIAATIAHNYELAGVPERFCFREYDEDHGYPASLRQAAYGWLLRWLKGRGDGSPVTEPPLDVLPEPYRVTYIVPPLPAPGRLHEQSPTVVPVPASLPGFCRAAEQPLSTEQVIDHLLQQRAQALPPQPALPVHPDDLPAWQRQVRDRIRRVLGPFPSPGPLRTRLFNQVWADGLMAERVTFESEPGITIPGLLVLPEEWRHALPFVVYVGEWGKQQGIASGLLERLVESGYGVLAVDVRGVGETATSDFEAATNALMLNRPLFGQRVWDVMRAVEFLWQRCYIAPQIDKGRLAILGEGVGGLLALYAAALDERVAAMAARGVPSSYTTLLKHGARFPASVYLFDVLRHFDIDHVAAACAPRPVFVQPVDGWHRPCRAAEARAAFSVAAAACCLAGQTRDSLEVASGGEQGEMLAWLERSSRLARRSPRP